MAIYSYTPLTTTGPYGTTYTLRRSEGIKIVELGKAKTKVYVSIQGTDIPEQPTEINFQKDTLPATLLAEIKQKRLAELTALAHDFDDRVLNTNMYVVSSLGFKVNADLRSQNNLRGLIEIIGDNTTNFIDYTNTAHELTKAQLEVLLHECAENGVSLYKQKWAYANSIKSATGKDDETLTQEFVFVMQDFSKEIVNEQMATL